MKTSTDFKQARQDVLKNVHFVIASLESDDDATVDAACEVLRTM